MPVPDRVEELRDQTTVTGLDFVYVWPDQVTLDVHFLHPPLGLQSSLANLSRGQVRITSVSPDGEPATVPVDDIDWEVVDAEDVLRVTTAVPGGFSRYRLAIDDPRVDPYFNGIEFSFKANCEADLDCKAPGHECPPEPTVDVPVDYTARDFWSFRRALLDFASLRYPHWEDRLEADAGVMLVEAMSALGDELAYYQDRIGREAYLATAEERRSLRRLAGLVDYPVHDGLAARGWLDVTVRAGQTAALPAGADVWATSDSGERVDFEVGRGLEDVVQGRTFGVDARRNTLPPHLWDEDDTCLPVGATELALNGQHAAYLPLDDTPSGRSPGRWVALRTRPTDPSVPARTHLVRLIGVANDQDPVLLTQITRLVWEEEQAVPFEMDLGTLELRGNLVPITAGRTLRRRFTIGPTATAAQEKDRPAALERRGPNGSTAFLFSLPDVIVETPMGPVDRRSRPGQAAPGLVRLGSDLRTARPDIRLAEVSQMGGNWVEGTAWEWRRSLIGVQSSQPGDRHFVLDDGAWDRVVGFRRPTEEVVHRDYVGGPGVTVRFGDGEFGLVPADGTVFQVTYRLGNGPRANLPAGSITRFAPADPVFAQVASVENSTPTEHGREPESPAEVRQLAPEEFRAVTYRAVRPEDYAEAAERLPWVQRAGASLRWTGSWLSMFVTPDPRGAVTLAPPRRAELVDQLDRFRQAGRAAHVLDPVYATLDLLIRVCVEPNAFPGEVKERLLEALFGVTGFRPRPGFFSPDRFTFGTPLERSELEAAIQSVPGVRAVEGVDIRRRGWFDWRPFTELAYEVGPAEVIRVESDVTHPERGSLLLEMEGGA